MFVDVGLVAMITTQCHGHLYLPLRCFLESCLVCSKYFFFLFYETEHSANLFLVFLFFFPSFLRKHTAESMLNSEMIGEENREKKVMKTRCNKKTLVWSVT